MKPDIMRRIRTALALVVVGPVVLVAVAMAAIVAPIWALVADEVGQ